MLEAMHARCVRVGLIVLALSLMACDDTKRDEEQGTTKPPAAERPAAAGADPTGAGLLDGFPVPDGATRDPGYPPQRGPLAERLFVVSDRSPIDVARWLPDAAKAAGWRCVDMHGGSFVCHRVGEKREISARSVAHPHGGTAYILGVLPGM